MNHIFTIERLVRAEECLLVELPKMKIDFKCLDLQRATIAAQAFYAENSNENPKTRSPWILKRLVG